LAWVENGYFLSMQKTYSDFKKCKRQSAYWTWDLDYVNATGKWKLINYLPDQVFEEQLADLDLRDYSNME
jgi:hypothetical protein